MALACAWRRGRSCLVTARVRVRIRGTVRVTSRLRVRVGVKVRGRVLRVSGADLTGRARADTIWVELRRDVVVRADMPLAAREGVVLDVRTERDRAHLVRVGVGVGVGVGVEVGVKVGATARV
jgi:hypothetical protein